MHCWRLYSACSILDLLIVQSPVIILPCNNADFKANRASQEKLNWPAPVIKKSFSSVWKWQSAHLHGTFRFLPAREFAFMIYVPVEGLAWQAESLSFTPLSPQHLQVNSSLIDLIMWYTLAWDSMRTMARQSNTHLSGGFQMEVFLSLDLRTLFLAFPDSIML